MAVEQPKPRPKGLGKSPKYTQGQGLGDVELRADLEKYMYGNPLAKLGYELYKEGKIKLVPKEPSISSFTAGSYESPSLAQKRRNASQGVLKYIQREELNEGRRVDPLKILVHELTHAGIDIIEAREKNRLRNLADEYAFEGRLNEPVSQSGFNPYGNVDFEEGVVRAGDSLIQGRLGDAQNLKKEEVGRTAFDMYFKHGKSLKDNIKNRKIFKQRYLDVSKAAQDILNERGIPPEATSPSDTREESFGRSFKNFFRTLVGKDKERNKLNYLGFAQPIDDEGNVYNRDVYNRDGELSLGYIDPSNPSKLNKGAALMALQEPAGLGTSPMTQKTSPPVGNKKTKVEKMPKRGAAPKVVDPRDEVMKLVAKKLKQDKTSVGIASPTAPMPTEMPAPMTTALANPQMPAKKVEEKQLLSPTPIMAAKGKSIEDGGKSKKKGKGLAVVIDMGSTEKPEYEEASMGTPSDPPPGATSDEVKDNQHVLLSEGELVVPANVVRYHGLGMYEGMRREALQGLGEMEDAGQVEYIDNEVKTAAAGMTIMNAQPNVATLGGIQKQQATYNPALGQYGTAAAPEAASAKFVSTGFIDRNKDGIDDKLQPSVKKTPVTTTAPTSITTSPAGLALGPTTDASTVVGAGNIGSYVSKQSGVPGSGDDKGTPVDNTIAPVAPTRVVQQQQDSGDDGGDPEISAGLGGARATIGGQEYALQYDFNGNVTGIANVADALSTGRANFIAPNPELASDLVNMTKGQINLLSGGLYGAITKEGKANREQTIALAEKIKAGNYGGLGMRPQDMPMPRPDGLGTSTMPQVATSPISPVNRQLAFGAGEKLGGAFGTTDVDYSPNTMVEGLLSPEAPKINITNFRDDAADVTFENIRGQTPTTDTVFDIDTNVVEGRNFVGDDFAPALDIVDARQKALPGIDGPANEAAIKQSKDLFDKQVERDLTRASSPYFNAPGFEMTPERYNQIQQEKDFDVEETFGSGRKEEREETNLRDQPNIQTPNTFVSDNFSSGGQDDVASRGGSVGIGTNDSGTTYSENQDGSFTHEDGTSVNFTDSSGKPGNAPTEQEARDARMADRDRQDRQAAAAGSDTSGGKIVCTEMYRQTQLEDWAQAMKTWHIYQKKYLTPIHEIGYHSLFKPFVRGMKVNKALTNLGAYLAKERTKHLRHILTKGKAQDSIVGNVFCKIIHPIVYLVGLAVHKK